MKPARRPAGAATSEPPARDDDAPRAPARTTRRRDAVVVPGLATALAVSLVVLLLRLVIPGRPPASLPTPAPLGPALTHSLVLVVVDGLRYDTATDPELMPELARRMRERSSAEIWAGQVSMTSSAVLTLATGQRGDMDQIVNNETARPTAYDTLMARARAAGLRTAAVGDRAWFHFFPGAWDLGHPDPDGVAIEVDYNDEIFAAAHEFLAAEPRPRFSVFHFVTPDHQAHAYGTTSERYRAHIHAFDRTLAALLAKIPDDTTVVVMSDHGATKTGEHGSDTPEQRRSPFVAWGPGIVADRHADTRLDQVDVVDTFAALLGVAPPAHSRGHALVEWLDVSAERRAAIACADLERLGRYASAIAGPGALAASGADRACAGPPETRVAAAATAARALDAAIDAGTVKGSPLGWLVPLWGIVGALAIAALVVVRRVPRAFVAATAAAIVLAALASHFIELLPGDWHQRSYVAFTVLGYLALLAAIARLPRTTAWAGRHPVAAAALLPGALVLSYTRSTQPHAFLVASVVLAVLVTVGLPAPGARPSLAPSRWTLRPARVACLVVLSASLAPVAFKGQEYLPEVVRSSPSLLLGAALASFAVLGAALHLRDPRRGSWVATAALVVVAGLSAWARRFAPAPLCVAAWAGLALLAPLAWARGRETAALLFALGSYAWVSRDAEVPILVGTLLLAALVGEALGALARREGPAPRPALVLLAVTVLFAWSFLQRIGVQLGLDFMYLDWGAGTFRQPDASILRIGLGIGSKHALALLGLLWLALGPLPPAHRLAVARGMLVAELVRASVLTTMLYVSRGSFWTAMRVMGDLPHALLAVVVTALVFAVLSLRARDVPGEDDERGAATELRAAA